MKLEFEKKEQNNLFDREEINFKVEGLKVTPSRQDLIDKIAAQLGCDKELVIVQKINTAYGKNVFTGKAKVYKSKETLNKIELPFVKKRNEPKNLSKKDSSKSEQSHKAKKEETKTEEKQEQREEKKE